MKLAAAPAEDNNVIVVRSVYRVALEGDGLFLRVKELARCSGRALARFFHLLLQQHQEISLYQSSIRFAHSHPAARYNSSGLSFGTEISNTPLRDDCEMWAELSARSDSAFPRSWNRSRWVSV
jgi:hypothetical protein